MPPSNRSEADPAAEGLLVDRCRRGDPGAFEEIYRRHAPRVYSLAYRLTGSLACAAMYLRHAASGFVFPSLGGLASQRTRPEDQGELLGVLLDLFIRAHLTEIAGRKATLTVQKSFDFDMVG